MEAKVWRVHKSPNVAPVPGCVPREADIEKEFSVQDVSKEVLVVATLVEGKERKQKGTKGKTEL